MTTVDQPLPTLSTVAAPVRCQACGCCPVDVCADAVEQGSSCALMAPAVQHDAVLRCPCAPIACRCELPAHVRGIARCRHGLRGAELVALALADGLLPATYRPRSGPSAIDRHCRRCGVGPGSRCHDLRRRADAPPVRLRPHLERRHIGPPNERQDHETG